MRKTLSIISLGCFRNTYDSEIVLKKFLDNGYILKDNCDDCDLLIINTCGFIDKAKHESLEVIKEAVRYRRKEKIKRLFVFGCLVQRYRKDLEKFFPEVDEWKGVENFNGRFFRRSKITPSHIDFLKICEGCINKCAYCAIPLIKGSLISKPHEEIIKEAKHSDKTGVKELNIIGQDITSWGKDFKDKGDLTVLIKSILKETKNIRWIRLIYTHPRHLTDSLIDLIAKEERICKYIDLPIQHISDRILKLMNRGTAKRQIISLIKKIRKKIPDGVIRTSLITGFPGETEEEFKELFSFVKDTEFERLGVFTYSREENTAAYGLPARVHYRMKERRFKEIMDLQEGIAQKINTRFLGQKIDVLVEDKEDNMFTPLEKTVKGNDSLTGFIGRTQYDAYDVDGIVILNKRGLKTGDFYRAKITDVYGYDLAGE